MNKWLQNNLVLQVISVLLAGVLWFMVHDYNQEQEGTQNYTQTKTMPITTEYDGEHYNLTQSHKEVTITMMGDPILIRYASSRTRAYINLEDRTEGVHRNVPVRVTGIPAGVKKTIQPEKINVTLHPKKVESQPEERQYFSKEIPLHITYNSVSKFLEVEQIRATPSQVTYYGDRVILEPIQMIDVPVELPKTEGIYRFRTRIPKASGVEKVEPMNVEIYVKMKRAKPKQINAIPLQLIHIGQGLDAQITSPATVDISVAGPANLLNSLRSDQVEAICDVASLPVGVHQVPIQIKLPEGIILESQSSEIAVVEIRSKPNSTGT